MNIYGINEVQNCLVLQGTFKYIMYIYIWIIHLNLCILYFDAQLVGIFGRWVARVFGLDVIKINFTNAHHHIIY